MDRGRAIHGDAERLDVESTDGTSIAVWISGRGAPIVLVHGSMNDHSAFGPLVSELGDDMTTFAMDRRGFGASGDRAAYSIDREFEDVAAVVDAVTGRIGVPVTLFGHSYGANCAMGGADLSDNVRHLVLYEPSLGLTYPPGSIEAIEKAVADGDPEAALLEVYRRVLEATDDRIRDLRESPIWETQMATAPTVARECRTEEAWEYEPGRFAGIAASTLLLAGSDSPPALAAATELALEAIPGSRVRVLGGHAHAAHKTNPDLVAAIIQHLVG